MLQDIDPQFLSETERYRRLARLERYFAGTQYDDRPDWYSTKDDVPARERRPCVIYPLPRAAVNQAVRFAIGEGKFPRLTVDEVDADDAFAPEFALSDEQAKELTEALENIARRSNLRSECRTMMRRGLSTGTAVVALSVREGRFEFEHPSAKDCIPTFVNGDPDGKVESLIWSYQYDEIERGDDGHPVCKRYAFRRDYDAVSVTEYAPAPIEVGKKIEWTVTESKPHGLGFCPIVWCRNLPDECGSAIDGAAIFDGLLDEIDALNFALSKRHQGIEVLGTPQPYEIGVQDGDGPGMAGRTAAPQPKDSRAPTYSSGAQRAARTRAARKTGPDQLWSYQGIDVELGLVETTGKAFEVASAHVNDIRARLLEAMDVILLDPTTVAGKGDMSAKALALMYAPMLALVDELREWWWEHALRPLLDMMLQAVSVLGPSVLVKGAAKLAATLKKRTVVIDGAEHWEPPTIEPLWGEYFAPSAEEITQAVTAATAAKTGGLIAAETASRFVANFFGVTEIEPELEAVEEEQAAATEEALKTAQATGGQPMGDTPTE